MTSIYNKIQEYAQKRDTHALQQLILGLNEDELINIIKTKVNSADFTYSWNYILQSFTDSADCHSKRFKMVLTLLNIEENDMPAIRRNTLINRLCIELMKFKSRHLADLCNYCLERIQSKKTQLTWKDLLPELLNVLAEREKFEYNDMEYTGLEYKTDFINSLCMSTWSPNIVTLLTSMFIDMPLTKEEHLKVVNKLGTYIEKMSPQEIPAFIYQLLKLCKQYNSRSVFLKLQLYFGSRIYNNANLNSNSSSDTNTNDLDVIENADNQDTIEAESTVLYHIHTAASLGHESIKDYLNSLKNITKSPEFVLNTFQLMILFTLSTIPHYEETVFDIVRPCIVRAYQEEQKKLHSAWFREMVPSTCKPEDILSQVIHFSLQDKESVIQGLVNFGFVLLAVGSSLGRDPIAEKQWNLGNIILLKIIKRKRHTALTIIQTLCNHIVTRQNVSQYIESLYVLCKTLPLLVLENQSCIVELMESLVQVPANVANQLLDAVIPLAKISPTIRDHLIILLRKALYSRVTETRQVAVNGFLKLLTNLKISSLAVLSQSSQCTGSFHSGHSLFTQLSINRSTQAIGSSNFSNEALCLEVLSILKRCFMQQKEVRSKLYEGLFDAVCVNLELGIPVLDLIWFHFSNYYIIDEEKLPPLDFGKITTIREEESILLEALGKFVYTIGLITSKVLESEEDRENQTVVRFVTILDSLCERMAKCELTHFELDENIDLSDNSLDSQQKTHVLKEAMCVYEALIGYKFCLWSKDSENHGQIINSLFQGYSRLSNIFKGFAKPKKLAAKKKKVDKNETRPASQANTTLKKDRQKAGKQLKPPETVLTFDVLKKILTLLHEPTVDWTTPAQANLIKVKYDFHQHIMQVTLHLIENVKRFKCVETRYKKMFYDHLTDVAAVLFHRIINRLTEFIDFDCATAALAVDCFHAILKLMTGQYRGNFRQFLQKIVTNDDDFITHLTTVTKVYQKISEMGEDDVRDSSDIKKMLVTAVNTLAILAGEIPTQCNPLSIQMCEWLKHFCYNNTVSSKVASPFINLFFETHIKYKVSLTLIEQISVNIGDVIGVITEEEHTAEKFAIVNEGTVHNILLSLCDNLKSILEDVDAAIARLKSEYIGLTYPGAENVEKKLENFKTKERATCCQVCFVVTIMTNLSNLGVQPGNESEVIFKNIMLVFSTLTLLTRHFVMRSSKVNLAFQAARFERLVKLAGKQLAPAVYRFILHIEEGQKLENQPTQSKKKNVDSSTLKSKVLRETRLIPKVIYEIEQFSKSVILLSNRTKVDLAKYIGQGTVRDFRILRLKEVLEEGENNPPNTQSTQATHVSGEEMEVDDGGQENRNVDDEGLGSPPLTKRSRK